MTNTGQPGQFFVPNGQSQQQPTAVNAAVPMPHGPPAPYGYAAPQTQSMYGTGPGPSQPTAAYTTHHAPQHQQHPAQAPLQTLYQQHPAPAPIQAQYQQPILQHPVQAQQPAAQAQWQAQYQQPPAQVHYQQPPTQASYQQPCLQPSYQQVPVQTQYQQPPLQPSVQAQYQQPPSQAPYQQPPALLYQQLPALLYQQPPAPQYQQHPAQAPYQQLPFQAHLDLKKLPPIRDPKAFQYQATATKASAEECLTDEAIAAMHAEARPINEEREIGPCAASKKHRQCKNKASASQNRRKKAVQRGIEEAWDGTDRVRRPTQTEAMKKTSCENLSLKVPVRHSSRGVYGEVNRHDSSLCGPCTVSQRFKEEPCDEHFGHDQRVGLQFQGLPSPVRQRFSRM
ncbi:hypothetical protein GCG54_00013081 [Colletotrichum gloeosporioides]|uniref:BZIP domain-containing protein n=1 Tax=Colletotrichum gloeosporioides TaxID=474922 RepID=A0A8H4C5G5_COLGL|nr:uncharacterized protein GCG54_00013081 [Colletotrichum gloeosporioides]KAF3797474.1 hypothetical protein GCG54_00013081 [Colletotrichum gloeosporioides]